MTKVVFAQSYINAFMALGKQNECCAQSHRELFDAENGELKSQLDKDTLLHSSIEVEMLLPVQIGDIRFLFEPRACTNVGICFRDPQNALLPNWLHLPVGYHGRASSIVVLYSYHRTEGADVADGETVPVFGPSKLLDFELEVAFMLVKKQQWAILSAPMLRRLFLGSHCSMIGRLAIFKAGNMGHSGHFWAKIWLYYVAVGCYPRSIRLAARGRPCAGTEGSPLLGIQWRKKLRHRIGSQHCA